MAKILKSVPRGVELKTPEAKRRNRYPWQEWVDAGRPVVVERGEDFEDANAFVGTLKATARRLGCTVAYAAIDGAGEAVSKQKDATAIVFQLAPSDNGQEAAG